MADNIGRIILNKKQWNSAELLLMLCGVPVFVLVVHRDKQSTKA
jgi:ABC-type Fe3+-siderophore transport system permease subunit